MVSTVVLLYSAMRSRVARYGPHSFIQHHTIQSCIKYCILCRDLAAAKLRESKAAGKEMYQQAVSDLADARAHLADAHADTQSLTAELDKLKPRVAVTQVLPHRRSRAAQADLKVCSLSIHLLLVAYDAR